MLKPSANPPITFPDAAVGTFVGSWFVGHTKARFEKAFAWDLHRAGIPYFLPMVEKLTFSGGRKRRGMSALFPGYVFFAGDELARYNAMSTDRLCQVIAVPDRAGLVVELSSLQVALANKAHFDPYPDAVVGRRCRVRSGPFLGVEGIIVQRDGISRLVLQVSMLGQSVAMEIAPELVESVQ